MGGEDLWPARKIRQIIRRCGYDLVRYDERFLLWWRTEIIRRDAIGLLIDVGANRGQTGQHFRASGFSGRIVSFEPSSRAFESLEVLARSDPNWHAERVALGAREGDVTLHISGNSASSSVLPMLDRHSAVAPEAEYVETELVPMRQLDSFRQALALTAPSWLKLDTQGYEDRVLAGARETLDTVRAIECELGLASLYEGQPDISAIIGTLSAHDFVPVALSPAFVDPATGELLQLDGIFVRGTR